VLSNSTAPISQTTITTNGLSFGALTCGDDGPLALCLHGFPDSAQTWRHLLPELAAAGYRAVAPWLRGYAPTTIPSDGDYSGAALAADVNALHDAAGGGADAVLIGHDWGAISTYAAGALAPDNWRRLVTLAVPPPAVASDSFFRYAQLKRSFYMFIFQVPVAELIAGADDMVFIERLWEDWSPGYEGGADLKYAKDALRGPANLSAAIGYYRAMFSTGGVDKSPSQPTLYLHGAADGCFGVEGVGASANHLSKDSEVDLIDGVGHFLHLEQPAMINAKILAWLAC
jgi:pimeloyl-ACP methyl ester carboxylesterase